MEYLGDDSSERMEWVAAFLRQERACRDVFEHLTIMAGVRRIRTRGTPDGSELVCHYNPIQIGGGLEVRLSENEGPDFVVTRRLEVRSNDPDVVASVADLESPPEACVVDNDGEIDHVAADPTALLCGDRDHLTSSQLRQAYYLGLAFKSAISH